MIKIQTIISFILFVLVAATLAAAASPSLNAATTCALPPRETMCHAAPAPSSALRAWTCALDTLGRCQPLPVTLREESSCPISTTTITTPVVHEWTSCSSELVCPWPDRIRAELLSCLVAVGHAVNATQNASRSRVAPRECGIVPHKNACLPTGVEWPVRDGGYAFGEYLSHAHENTAPLLVVVMLVGAVGGIAMLLVAFSHSRRSGSAYGEWRRGGCVGLPLGDLFLRQVRVRSGRHGSARGRCGGWQHREAWPTILWKARRGTWGGRRRNEKQQQTSGDSNVAAGRGSTTSVGDWQLFVETEIYTAVLLLALVGTISVMHAVSWFERCFGHMRTRRERDAIDMLYALLRVVWTWASFLRVPVLLGCERLVRAAWEATPLASLGSRVLSAWEAAPLPPLLSLVHGLPPAPSPAAVTFTLLCSGLTLLTLTSPMPSRQRVGARTLGLLALLVVCVSCVYAVPAEAAATPTSSATTCNFTLSDTEEAPPAPPTNWVGPVNFICTCTTCFDNGPWAAHSLAVILAAARHYINMVCAEHVCSLLVLILAAVLLRRATSWGQRLMVALLAALLVLVVSAQPADAAAPLLAVAAGAGAKYALANPLWWKAAGFIGKWALSSSAAAFVGASLPVGFSYFLPEMETIPLQNVTSASKFNCSWNLNCSCPANLSYFAENCTCASPAGTKGGRSFVGAGPPGAFYNICGIATVPCNMTRCLANASDVGCPCSPDWPSAWSSRYLAVGLLHLRRFWWDSNFAKRFAILQELFSPSSIIFTVLGLCSYWAVSLEAYLWGSFSMLLPHLLVSYTIYKFFSGWPGVFTQAIAWGAGAFYQRANELSFIGNVYLGLFLYSLIITVCYYLSAGFRRLCGLPAENELPPFLVIVVLLLKEVAENTWRWVCSNAQHFGDILFAIASLVYSPAGAEEAAGLLPVSLSILRSVWCIVRSMVSFLDPSTIESHEKLMAQYNLAQRQQLAVSLQAMILEQHVARLQKELTMDAEAWRMMNKVDPEKLATRTSKLVSEGLGLCGSALRDPAGTGWFTFDCGQECPQFQLSVISVEPLLNKKQKPVEGVRARLSNGEVFSEEFSLTLEQLLCMRVVIGKARPRSLLAMADPKTFEMMEKLVKPELKKSAAEQRKSRATEPRPPEAAAAPAVAPAAVAVGAATAPSASRSSSTHSEFRAQVQQQFGKKQERGKQQRSQSSPGNARSTSPAAASSASAPAPTPTGKKGKGGGLGRYREGNCGAAAVVAVLSAFLPQVCGLDVSTASSFIHSMLFQERFRRRSADVLATRLDLDLEAGTDVGQILSDMSEYVVGHIGSKPRHVTTLREVLGFGESLPPSARALACFIHSAVGEGHWSAAVRRGEDWWLLDESESRLVEMPVSVGDLSVYYCWDRSFPLDQPFADIESEPDLLPPYDVSVHGSAAPSVVAMMLHEACRSFDWSQMEGEQASEIRDLSSPDYIQQFGVDWVVSRLDRLGVDLNSPTITSPRRCLEILLRNVHADSAGRVLLGNILHLSTPDTDSERVRRGPARRRVVAASVFFRSGEFRGGPRGSLGVLVPRRGQGALLARLLIGATAVDFPASSGFECRTRGAPTRVPSPLRDVEDCITCFLAIAAPTTTGFRADVVHVEHPSRHESIPEPAEVASLVSPVEELSCEKEDEWQMVDRRLWEANRRAINNSSNSEAPLPRDMGNCVPHPVQRQVYSDSDADEAAPTGLAGHGRKPPPPDTECCECHLLRDAHERVGQRRPEAHVSSCSVFGCKNIAFGKCGRASPNTRTDWRCTSCTEELLSTNTAQGRLESRRRREATTALSSLPDEESAGRDEIVKENQSFFARCRQELKECITSRQVFESLRRAGASALAAALTSPATRTTSTSSRAAPTASSSPSSSASAASVQPATAPSDDPIALAAFNNDRSNVPQSNFVTKPPPAVEPAPNLEYAAGDFLCSQGQVPSLAPIPRGALVERATIKSLEEIEQRSDLAFSGLSTEVRKQHLRWWQVLQDYVRQHPASGRSLEETAAACLRELGFYRSWQWQTLHRNMCSMVGALSNAPIYTNLSHPLSLAVVAPYWKATMAAVRARAQVSKPHGQVAVTLELLSWAVEEEQRLWVRVALILMWLSSGRVGDVLQLRLGNNNISLDKENLTLRVTFTHGKGVLLRGESYTVHTVISRSWAEDLEQYLSLRRQQVAQARGDPREALLFPATPGVPLPKRTSVLLRSLRTAHPALNLRGMRRGSLQTAMECGATLADIQLRAGHTNPRTTRGYLDAGRLDLEAAAAAPRIAAGLGVSKLSSSAATVISNAISNFLPSALHPARLLRRFRSSDYSHLPIHAKDVACRLNVAALRDLPAHDPAVLRELEYQLGWLVDDSRYEKVRHRSASEVPVARLSAAHVQTLLERGLIAPVDPAEVRGGVRLFTVPELSKGRLRRISHTADANEVIPSSEPGHEVRMATKEQIVRLVHGGSHMASHDIAGYFDQLAYGPEVSRRFCFRSGGKCYRLLSCAMGCRNSPAVASAITWHLLNFPRRSKRCEIVIDNIIFVGDKEDVIADSLEFRRRCAAANVLLNDVDVPIESIVTQRGEWCGVVLDLVAKTVCLTQKVVERTALSWSLRHAWTWRGWASCVGLCMWSHGIIESDVHRRYALLRFLSRVSADLQEREDLWDAPCTVWPSAMRDIESWVALIQANKPRRVPEHGDPEWRVVTDASRWGWGYVAVNSFTGEIRTHGSRWSDYMQSVYGDRLGHSTVAEPHGIVNSLCHLLRGRDGVKAVRIGTDNLASSCVFTRGFSSHSQVLNECVGRLRQAFPELEVEMRYVPGVHNPADRPSRGQLLSESEAIEAAASLRQVLG